MSHLRLPILQDFSHEQGVILGRDPHRPQRGGDLSWAQVGGQHGP